MSEFYDKYDFECCDRTHLNQWKRSTARNPYQAAVGYRESLCPASDANNSRCSDGIGDVHVRSLFTGKVYTVYVGTRVSYYADYSEYAYDEDLNEVSER